MVIGRTLFATAVAALGVVVVFGCSTPAPQTCCSAKAADGGAIHTDAGTLSSFCACGSTQGSLACTASGNGATCTLTCTAGGQTTTLTGTVVSTCGAASGL